MEKCRDWVLRIVVVLEVGGLVGLGMAERVVVGRVWRSAGEVRGRRVGSEGV